jgi:dipeptidyl aminopeptidase/acylaminoacyl peptidase
MATPFSRRRLLLSFLVAALALLSGCQKQGGVEPAFPPPTPGLEPQAEDYATARRTFHTKLLRKGPAPQPWEPVQPPTDVTEVEYASGGLRLKAWVSGPAGDAAKHPAVLYLHGGFAFDLDDWEQSQPLRDAGFVVLTPLLRGENGQPGHFTMFYDEVEDVLATADCLAKLPGVDPQRVYVAGHSAGGTLAMLAAMASGRFRAAASLSGSPDQVVFVQSGWGAVVPFDQADIRELQVRSPVAYAASFKCPARLYVGSEEGFLGSTRRTALLAKGRGLDVEAVVVPGDHFSYVPEALRQTIAFFQSK